MTVTADDLITDAGFQILADENYADDEWTDISLVATLTPERTNLTGYRYADEDWYAETPRHGRDLIDILRALQDTMVANTGNRWKQALIHITRPGPEIDIQFEYDDATRWSLKKVSLDLADYAESLRPPGANK